IMEKSPIPIIMVSSYTEEGSEITFKALELGAVDYILKPEKNDIRNNIELLKKQLLNKIKIFANYRFKNKFQLIDKQKTEDFPQFDGLPSLQLPKKHKGSIDVIGIGASTGGTVALSKILADIKPKIGLPILIVQHMPRLYTKNFAKRLNNLSMLEVVEAENELLLEPNKVYIAQGDHHMYVDNNHIMINQDELVNNHRPSVDVLFHSLAKEFQNRVMAFILTGMGSDGAKGIVNIKIKGGFTIAQNEESSVVFGMPGSAINTGKIDRIMPLDNIAEFINDFFIG
ncbi:MAG: chemotaxis-specific protein-glutamate methyltransferase CheB, partial [Spirochaetes bacterium]|nr:chemotaxis-specific protein-glutamate methyltransferase CheB [Spirochaetota bacterium]